MWVETPCERFQLIQEAHQDPSGDHTRPRCSNCANARKKRTCIYGELKLRHSKFSSATADEVLDLPQTQTTHYEYSAFDTPPQSVDLRHRSVPFDADHDVDRTINPISPSLDLHPGNYVPSSHSHRSPDAGGRSSSAGVDLDPYQTTADSPLLQYRSPVSSVRDDCNFFVNNPLNDGSCALFRFYKDHAGRWVRFPP